jgi:Cytochrome c554 and c-prime
MTARAAALFCAAVMSSSVRAAPAGSFAGAQACHRCHAAEFKLQAASAHAGALSRVSDHPGFPAGIKLSRAPQYSYEILRIDRGLRVHIQDGADLMDLPLEWVFGAGSQANTFVTRVNQDWYVEHYASWYAATNSYGPTPGQEAVHPKSISEAAGVLYSINDPQFGIKGCFECHSTGPVSFDGNGDAKVNESGVRCESCHGPGGEHTADPRHHRLTNPGKFSAAALNEFCGRCHRPPAAKSVTIDWNYSWNVRHQPVYLSQSLCFLKSRGELSCLTCHEPHEPAARKPVSFFNQKCLQCHSGSGKLHQTGCLAKGRSNCIDCHMPLVSPQPPLRFTNHWIGIYRTGAKLKPVR